MTTEGKLAALRDALESLAEEHAFVCKQYDRAPHQPYHAALAALSSTGTAEQDVIDAAVKRHYAMLRVDNAADTDELVHARRALFQADMKLKEAVTRLLASRQREDGS